MKSKNLDNQWKNVINITNLTVYYQNVCALYNVNLKVKDKEFLGIIGPNGGGKSTLLKAILGLIPPSSGKVEVYGKPAAKAQGIMGYVPQFTRFHRDFPITVEETVLMGRLSGKTPIFHKYSKKDMDIAHSLMNKLEIYPLRKRQIGQLSGGQLQRALIARALAVEPKILVLDEPTASLDADSKSHIYSILEELNKDMTIIMVTHDMSAISSHVQSLACLNRELYYHGHSELSEELIHQLYGCPIDLIAHGLPHRVLKEHGSNGGNNLV
ncbi:MAG: ABC transporter ATP-binding protein [Clostridiales bacterium]|jgi:zinc transport system ATP-binding protein|nr:ABC transporter ATP-binding protein [Clostridiales bacterium]